MADGGRAGKVTGQELAAEMQAKAVKEAADFAAMGAQVTGHGAQTVCDPPSSILTSLAMLHVMTQPHPVHVSLSGVIGAV